MQIGDLVSNATAISVATSGRTCKPAWKDPTTGTTGTHTFGFLSFIRSVMTPRSGYGSVADSVRGDFWKITFSSSRRLGSQLDLPPYAPALSLDQPIKHNDGESRKWRYYQLERWRPLGIRHDFGGRFAVLLLRGSHQRR
jgi:hypothetical protein